MVNVPIPRPSSVAVARAVGNPTPPRHFVCKDLQHIRTLATQLSFYYPELLPHVLLEARGSFLPLCQPCQPLLQLIRPRLDLFFWSISKDVLMG